MSQDHRRDADEDMDNLNKLQGRPYTPPKLTDFGLVANLTAGGSVGIGDSGSATTRRPPF